MVAPRSVLKSVRAEVIDAMGPLSFIRPLRGLLAGLRMGGASSMRQKCAELAKAQGFP
jgi:hypothetical protein